MLVPLLSATAAAVALLRCLAGQLSTAQPPPAKAAARQQQRRPPSSAAQTRSASSTPEEQAQQLVVTPVGFYEGIFRNRGGIPRQGTLCAFSRGRVRLDLDLLGGPRRTVGTHHLLEGLADFSHAIILWHFHANPAHKGVKFKVSPPRLGGEKRGIFGTRSPIRPNPIGISVVRIERVEGTCVHVSGADLLDGTPIIDIKPYVPYSDCLPEATAPAWVTPLATAATPSNVVFTPQAHADLAAACARGLRILRDAAEAEEAISQILAVEPRPTQKRGSTQPAIFHFCVDNLNVHSVFHAEADQVVVYSVEHWPLAAPQPTAQRDPPLPPPSEQQHAV